MEATAVAANAPPGPSWCAWWASSRESFVAVGLTDHVESSRRAHIAGTIERRLDARRFDVKNPWIVALCLMAAPAAEAGTLAVYDFTGLPGTEVSVPVVAQPPN